MDQIEIDIAELPSYDTDVIVRDETKREIDVRIVPWDKVIDTVDGQETVVRGAFDDTRPEDIVLYGMEHEVSLGLGQDLRPKFVRRAAGRGISTDNRPDGQHVTFRVAKTVSGDEMLALAADGVYRGVSAEWEPVPGGTEVRSSGGRRMSTVRHAKLTGGVLTLRPAYLDANVIAVRSEKETGPMAEATEATAVETAVVPVTSPAFDPAPIVSSITQMRSGLETSIAAFGDRMAALEEANRKDIVIPGSAVRSHPDDFTRGDWAKTVLRMLSGEQIAQRELELRVAADLITTDNLGVVPPAYLSELIGIIDPARPFLGSTRRLTTPRSGMQFIMPKLGTRPTVGVQDPEKEELTSTAVTITTESFDAVTVGGYGDISLQLLKRSDPSFLELFVDLLGEAYAVKADDLAVDALLAEGTVHSGGTVDPNDGPQFGDAWAFGSAVSRRLTPDTIWLSSSAVAAFIDAKSDTTNAPLYANLAGNFTAGGGPGGTISGLRPVHVPALDDESVDAIVGPSRGFAWAEDGAFTLQVDVPAKAGRDVALVGILWFAPIYPAAFTKYVVAS